MIMKNPQSSLPPGFRFHPTDEELILHYLRKKLTSSQPFPASLIADVDIYKFDPWDLPAKAAFGEKEWYFFSPRDRKYPNGARPNRAAGSGYWKATGTDKVIVTPTIQSVGVGFGGIGSYQQHQETIGVKKALVFYKGRPPKGAKTNWIMHEYRLSDSATSYNTNRLPKPKEGSMRLDDWVLCRIYKKSQALSPAAVAAAAASDYEEEEEERVSQETQPPYLQQTPFPATANKSLMPQKSSSFSNLLDAVDYSLISSFLSDTNQLNTLGNYESTPPTLLNTNSAMDNNNQNFINNYNNNSYFCPASFPIVENKLKRELSNIDHGENFLQYPSKRLMTNSCISPDMSNWNQQLQISSWYMNFQG